MPHHSKKCRYNNCNIKISVKVRVHLTKSRETFKKNNVKVIETKSRMKNKFKFNIPEKNGPTSPKIIHASAKLL
jgi:hypothetical protein